MPKKIYTEKDIEDLVLQGIMTLEVNDRVLLTDLAYEKANRLGMRLLQQAPDNPPSAPVRPYITTKESPQSSVTVTANPATFPHLAASNIVPVPAPSGEELHQRIRSAVVARLGNQVDANLLDVIITRVLQSTGVK